MQLFVLLVGLVNLREGKPEHWSFTNAGGGTGFKTSLAQSCLGLMMKNIFLIYTFNFASNRIS